MAMAYKKTQIYLTPRQHRGLSREADKLGISLAELFRRLAQRYLEHSTAPKPTSQAIRGIVKLGRSGRSDTSRDHHRALDEALRGAPLR